MITDTPAICFARAAASRSEAEDATLKNVRDKLLLSAAAWDDLARILHGRTSKNLQIGRKAPSYDHAQSRAS